MMSQAGSAAFTHTHTRAHSQVWCQHCKCSLDLTNSVLSHAGDPHAETPRVRKSGNAARHSIPDYITAILDLDGADGGRGGGAVESLRAAPAAAAAAASPQRNDGITLKWSPCYGGINMKSH